MPQAFHGANYKKGKDNYPSPFWLANNLLGVETFTWFSPRPSFQLFHQLLERLHRHPESELLVPVVPELAPVLALQLVEAEAAVEPALLSCHTLQLRESK
jgi:hypothetical protein